MNEKELTPRNVAMDFIMIKDDNVKNAHKIVFAIIANLADVETWSVQISIKELAKKADYLPKYLSTTIISELCEMGYIKKEKVTNKRGAQMANRYTIIYKNRCCKNI